MTYTVQITEINRGYAEFETQEDAEDFLKRRYREIDYDLVTWNSSELTEALIESPD